MSLSTEFFCQFPLQVRFGSYSILIDLQWVVCRFYVSTPSIKTLTNLPKQLEDLGSNRQKFAFAFFADPILSWRPILSFYGGMQNHFCVKPNFNWGFVGGFTTKSQCYFVNVSTTKFQIIINHRHKRRRKYYISIGLQKKITKIRARKLPWQGE